MIIRGIIFAALGVVFRYHNINLFWLPLHLIALLRVNPGLTICEDLAMVLLKSTLTPLLELKL